METPLWKLADQLARETIRLDKLIRRRKASGLNHHDEEIDQLKRSLQIKHAILEGLKRSEE